ncbi:hypothetical protein ACGFNU_23500 [Spirillospora sp. NPDC048911]|uniref:hypothetical protein n=1 Tax=Spirillospora sp. NPDC048911 TaxID=3364527 RepID=UPI00370FA2BE
MTTIATTRTVSAALGEQATKHAAEGRTFQPITGLNDTPHSYDAAHTGRPLRSGPVKRCPSCRTPLDGGPVRFRCHPCGTPVMAADIDTEYHPGALPNPDRVTGDHEGRNRR